MQVTKEQVDPCTVSLEIEVDAETVDRAYDRAYREFAHATRVPGFRPGKAPRSILERYVDADRVSARAKDIVAAKAYRDALQQESIEPFDEAEADLPEIAPGEPYRFKTQIPLPPQVTLGDYSDVVVERPVYEVTDDDVERQIERLREENARLVPAEGRGVRDGDVLIAEVATTLEGDEPAEPSRSLVRVGSNIPGFDLNIMDQQVDDERTFTLRYADDYEDKERAGKQATFYVKVIAINERRLPDLDDRWVADATRFQTIDELRVGLREQIVEETTRTSDEIALNRIVQALIDRSTVTFPHAMVVQEVQRDLVRLGARLEDQGVSYDDYLAHNKMTREDHQAQLIARNEDRVRARLVLRALAEKEGLTITDEDVESELGKILDESAIDAKDARRLMKSERHRNQVTTMLTQRHINDLLRRIATIKDVAMKDEEPAGSNG